MSAFWAQFINTFGAFGLALVAFGVVACVVWSHVITPVLAGKNKIQERYVDSLEVLLTNHSESSKANLETQKEMAMTMAKIGQNVESGFGESKRNHDRMQTTLDGLGKTK